MATRSFNPDYSVLCTTTKLASDRVFCNSISSVASRPIHSILAGANCTQDIYQKISFEEGCSVDSLLHSTAETPAISFQEPTPVDNVGIHAAGSIN